MSLWRLEPADGEIIRLTKGHFDVAPVCAPDGSWVYYVSPTFPDHKIQRVSIDAAKNEVVSEPDVVFPTLDISRDGQLLAFSSIDVFGVINANDGKVRKTFPVDARMGSSSGSSTYLRFTPDGKALAYCVHVKGVDNIWGQPLDGAAAYPITNFDSEEIVDFGWSPIGDRLGVVRGRRESNAVLIRAAN